MKETRKIVYLKTVHKRTSQESLKESSRVLKKWKKTSLFFRSNQIFTTRLSSVPLEEEIWTVSSSTKSIKCHREQH